jgi:hypothetical protein
MPDQSRTGMAVSPAIQKLKEFQGESPSVFDTPGRKLGRFLAKFIPTGLDPADSMMPMSSPAALGVTTFLKHGVPDVASRTQATKRALAELAETLAFQGVGKRRGQAAMTEAARRPRLLAHVSSIRPLTKNSALSKKAYGLTLSTDNGKSQLRIGKPGLFAPSPAKVLRHELTHAAQEVGLKNFDPQRLTPQWLEKYNATPTYSSDKAIMLMRDNAAPFKRPDVWSGHMTPGDRLYLMLSKHPDIGYKHNPFERSAFRKTTTPLLEQLKLMGIISR